MSHALLLFLLLIGQDETEYNRLVDEMRFMVRSFKEPEDGVVIRPPAYWERAVRVTREIERFRPTAMRELYAAQQLFAGMLNLSRGDTRVAIAEFEHGLRLEPNEAPMFYYALGLAASAERRLGDAESAFKRAAGGAPHWAAPGIALAATFLDLGRVADARELLTASLDLGLTEVEALKSRQYFLLAKIFEASGNLKDAEAVLRTAIDFDNNNPLLADSLGMLLLKAGARDRSLEVWKSALRAFPANAALTREIALTENGIRVTGARDFTDAFADTVTAASPMAPGGSRYRAYRVEARAGDMLKFRVDSRAFTPFLALVGVDGKAVAMQDIRSSYFSLLEHRVTTPGTYHLIVAAYAAGQTGGFELSVPK